MKIRSGQTGFTLTEIIIVVMILGIGAVPVLNLFLTGTAGTSRTAHRAVGVHLAQETLEILSNFSFDQLKDLKKGMDAPEFNKVFGARFEKTITLTDLIPGRLKQIEVTVKWKERGQAVSVVLSTIVCEERTGKRPPGPGSES